MSADDERYNKFEKFLADAAEKLERPVDNDRVRLLATLKLALETTIERMIVGDKHFSADHVKTLTDAINEMLPPEPKSLGLKWVESISVGVYDCLHCGQRNELPEGTYPPQPQTPQDRPPRTAAEPAAAAAPPLPPPPPKPEVPLWQRMLKDTRPTAGNSNSGSVCIVTSANASPNPQTADPHPYLGRYR
jgi:hypothetical protein